MKGGDSMDDEIRFVRVYYGSTSHEILLIVDHGDVDVIGTGRVYRSHLRAARTMHRLVRRLRRMGYDARTW